ncbi:unnamed protein product [Linum trigynum]|uniref:AAA+ ATPase At3g28540-like C-terminal domain-containing protein n=1 Tax=Linum trigynum TaxID=586398 RepID=A0AAV2GU45_9ROSI
MDKHVELLYCIFEAFGVLAKNCHLLDDHQLFDKICQLLQQTKMTTADVAEHLMPKTVPPNVDVCLSSPEQGLEVAEEEVAARSKVEEEGMNKEEKEISAAQRSAPFSISNYNIFCFIYFTLL